MRGTGASNTDSELYGNGGIGSLHRQGNTGIGGGSQSLAVRQAERREKEKAVLKEVEI